MSLINGMDEMFSNPEAQAWADSEILINDEFATEAMESIDFLVDGVPEDYPEIYDDDDYEEALEAAGLTDQAFLNSLNYAKDDMTDKYRKLAGSLGPNSSAANFSSNFSDGVDDNEDDVLASLAGSLGPDTSEANFPENFHDEYVDDNDPLITHPGSLGPDTSVARDPSMESTIALGFLMDDESEDFDEYIAQEGLRSWNKQRKEKKRYLDERAVGVPSLDTAAIDQLCKDGNWAKAESMVSTAKKQVEAKRASFSYGDKESKAKDAAAKRLIQVYNGLLVHISMMKNQSELVKKGYDNKTAKRAARSKVKELKKSLKNSGKLDKGTEAAIDSAINFDIAMEAFEEGNLSVGQQDSRANFSGNFSFGSDDPSATYTDRSPGASSMASFESNYGGGFLNEADPILTGDSSVGYNDSTPRDPATESYQDILDELNSIETELLC